MKCGFRGGRIRVGDLMKNLNTRRILILRSIWKGFEDYAASHTRWHQIRSFEARWMGKDAPGWGEFGGVPVGFCQ